MSKAETIRSGNAGKTELRLVRKDGRFFGLADGKVCVDGEAADDVWRRLHDEAGKANPKYFGFAGARKRFLHFFPGGFHSPGYASRERDYKVAAKKKLDAVASPETATTASNLGGALLKVFQATNLLSPFETMNLQKVLRGRRADDFVHAAAAFTLQAGKGPLLDMAKILKTENVSTWPAATYLPFLWRPEAHMFLKPEVTKDFAARVGHRLANDYEAKLDFAVYESLLDLAAMTTAELADLKPRDRVDVQSFIWIVGSYEDDLPGDGTEGGSAGGGSS